MPVVKKEIDEKKNPVKKPSVKKEKVIVESAPEIKKTNVSFRSKPAVDENKIPKEILEDPNISPIFDVFIYRELFMALRQKLDDLFEKREKSEKDSALYDDAVYNITNNAITEAAAQDFLSYCYKKGKYDFCVMNYEKYMKWSILAASNGNAFTLSKLQIFLTNAVNAVLSIDNHDYMIDFLELTDENYYTFLSKLICEEMVKILQFSAESLIKMPEVYQEQNEEFLRLFDNAKMDAADAVKITLKNAIDQLKQILERESQQRKEEQTKTKEEFNKQQKENEEESIDEKDDEKEVTKEVTKERSSAFKKAPTIRKFRW